MIGGVAAVSDTDLYVVGYIPSPAHFMPVILLLLVFGLALLVSLAALVLPLRWPFLARAGAQPAAHGPTTIPQDALAQDVPVAEATGPTDAATPSPGRGAAIAVSREPVPLVGGASLWAIQRALAVDLSYAVPMEEEHAVLDRARVTSEDENAPPVGEIDRRMLEHPPRQPDLMPSLLKRYRRALPVTSSALSTSTRDAAHVLARDLKAGNVGAALRVLIDRFTVAFPGRIRACYVYGSYADGSDVEGSDVDFAVVFAGSWHGIAERETAVALLAACAGEARVALDGEVVTEAELDGGVFPDLKLASRLAYGTDVRDQLALMPIEEWTRDRMHSAYFLIATRFHRPGSVTLPLEYPDPAGPFYGYDRRPIRLPSGTEEVSTRDLLRVAGWSATALVALRAGEYVVRKRDSHLLYRRYIGDDWSDLLDELYTVCRGAWHYRIPEREDERQRLRALCAAMHGFENHVLGIYRDYLLGELALADGPYAQRLMALMDTAPFQDPTIQTTMGALRERNAAEPAAGTA